MTQTRKSSEPGPGPACCPDLGSESILRMFRALADPNRASILARMVGCCEPRTVSDLASCCPVDFSVVSRHLAVLRDAGILGSERKGRQVVYTLRAAEVAAQLRRLADALDACACPAPHPPAPGTAEALHPENGDEHP